ncbi:metal dependent phosphohydrolase [Desulfovibrio piger]|uniref:5'-deoxynucleotidase n=2 Tax=Desulfovibrio piger TaxID=901 RepID=A0A1K1LFL4_9BACT|nr:metal dependent phosphohydrolase [Desulfovibrio piger]
MARPGNATALPGWPSPEKNTACRRLGKDGKGRTMARAGQFSHKSATEGAPRSIHKETHMAQDSPNKSTPAADLPDARQLERITDFFHEAGHLRHTPRSGYAFLGSGSENVAEHSYRTSVIGYTLAKLAGADAARVTFLCLFHDLHEARTGDFNYVNHRYDTCRDREALQDAVDGTGLEQDILDGWDEWQERRSLEARLAHDADQLDLICNLKAELDKGNKFAADWLESAVKRLRSPQAQALCEVILRTDHNRWWYGRVDKTWWIDRK